MESAPEGETCPITFLLLQAAAPSAQSFSATVLTILLIIILVLLLLTAITAGAETAYFSLKAKDINYLKTKEQPAARQAVRLLDQPKLLLATILVANNFINIAIIIATNLLVNQLIPPNISEFAGFLIQIVAVTFLLVLFGEVLPKVYATQNNMRMALFSAPVITVMNSIFKPISRTLVSSTAFIETRLGSKKGNSGNLSNEDFEHAIELTVGHTATREEVNIFKGILKFGNITARQIMHTRLDVAAIQYDMTFPEVQQYAIVNGYSRMPVYKESLDSVAGILHTKDFIPHTEDDNLDWHTLIRPAFFVHEGKLIEDLLHEFQQRRIHLAVVVDEFGGTSGIVTLEDIMEEIIGDIKDEFDEDDPMFRKVDEHNFLFEGKTLINDMCRMMGLPTDTFEGIRGESDSLAGLILEISGKFPSVNETVNYREYELTVLEVDKMRIRRVKVTVNEPEEDEELN